jgi:ABC-type branched-subunit amino acid transport system ATPase component
MDTSEEILGIKGVGYAYGGVWAVNDCSFSVSRGRVTGLIGPNGAGKSTMIELISGFLGPHRGSIEFNGAEIGGTGPTAAGRMGIVRTFQVSRLLPRLSVLENVMIGAQGQVGESPLTAIFRRRAWSRQEAELRSEALELLSWVGLYEHVDSPASSLSGGQRRLLEIARALMAHPTLMLLDEPTAGVFPETTRLIATRVRDVSARGITVLLIAHNMDFLSSVADEVVVMAEGRVLTRGTLESVRNDEQVVSAYLGVPTQRFPLKEHS